MTSLRATFSKSGEGKTSVNCRIQLHWFLILFFCLWFGLLTTVAALMTGAALFGPVKPPMDQVVPSVAIMLVMIAAGGGFFALFRFGLGTGESAYLIEALEGALNGKS